VAKASKPKTVGRPKKQIDTRQVQRLACVALSPAQIATILDANEKTIERNFGTVIKKSREKLCHQLRYKIYERAMAGDTACLIFAGKVLAGLKEPRDDAVNVQVNTIAANNVFAVTDQAKKHFAEIDQLVRREAALQQSNGEASE
jgi:hypothetical protein